MPRPSLLAGLCLLIPLACGQVDGGDDLPPGAFTSGPGNDTGIDTASGDSGQTSLVSATLTGDTTAESGSSSTGIVGPISHEQHILPIWLANCLGPSCHDAASIISPLDLETDGQYTRVCEGTHGMTGLPYIDCDGSDPQRSYLFRKLENTHMEMLAGNGGLMPPTGMLDDATLNLIETWISEGAMP